MNEAPVSDRLLAEEIEPKLVGRRFGLPLHSYGRVGSTNEIASRLAATGAPEGTLVTAEEQFAGRGRQGKVWHSPPGVGLWMSLVLRPSFEPHRAAAIPLVGALAIAEGIRSVSGACPDLKWPNDVYLKGRKIAGVLGESAVEGSRVRFAVLGMGVNVNLSEAQWPTELRETACSLAMVTGRTWDRGELLAAVLAGFEERYVAYEAEGFDAIRTEFLDKSLLLGKSVDLLFPNRTVSGTVLDLSPDGEIMLATAAGTTCIRVGEASLRMK